MTNTTCQICGRPIKANTGVIAHHGYQRPYRGSGWQTASCHGARNLPYEQSCDAIPPEIKLIKYFLDRDIKALDNLIDNPPDVLLDYWREKEYTVERPSGFNPNKYLYASSIPKTYEYVFSRKIADLKRDISGAEREIEYLTKRLADWKAPAILSDTEMWCDVYEMAVQS